MRIEAVTVCVFYADFLSETIKTNLGLFDSWTVVTSPKDYATRTLCRKHNLKVILSDDATRTSDDFNKGRLIERGLQHLSAEGWRLHIDADIALPHDFRHRLISAHLREDSIYGVDRIMVKSWDQWQTLLKSGYLNGGQYSYHCYMTLPPGLATGARWIHPQLGYVPIGYFQLWHSSQDEWHGTRIKPYPNNHGNACRSDVKHALQWDRDKRGVIPELYSIHLESANVANGMNWNGRKTPQFGPVDPRSLQVSDKDYG